MQELTLTAQDGHQIQTYVWATEDAKAWVHINHGMAEHAVRYDRLAQELNNAGFSVVAHNHRGHGSSTTTILGQYAEEQGWDKVLSDIDIVRDNTCDANLPYILMGHSMGSFIVQSYLTQTDRKIDGLILSGSNYQNTMLIRAGKVVANLEALRLGKNKISKLLNFLSFGAFNQAFKPARTEFDWLSRDHQEVDKYIADDLCGFDCTISLWLDLFDGLIGLYNPAAFRRIQSNLPIFIFGGDKDPVGEKGKGLPKLKKAYEAAGQTHIHYKLYQDGRHEMLNESNRNDVMNDITSWLQDLNLNQQSQVAS